MNQIALAFVKAREICKLAAYQDSGGIWTVGWGATGPGIVAGTVWTQAEADADLEHRLGLVEMSVSHLLGNGSFSVQQRAALISFEYNCGAVALAQSHLLQFVLKRNWIAAAKAFLQFDHAAGTELQGLLKRRMYEGALFLEGSA